MVDYLVDHWHWIVPLAGSLLLGLLNLLTEHPDLASGRVRRWVLVALDVLSLLQSAGSARGGGLPVKAPLLQRSPPATTSAATRRRLEEIRRQPR